MLNRIHVEWFGWPNNSLEICRMFFKWNPHSCGEMTWCIVIHKNSIIVFCTWMHVNCLQVVQHSHFWIMICSVWPEKTSLLHVKTPQPPWSHHQPAQCFVDNLGPWLCEVNTTLIPYCHKSCKRYHSALETVFCCYSPLKPNFDAQLWRTCPLHNQDWFLWSFHTALFVCCCWKFFRCVTSLCHSKQAAARCIVLSGWLWLKLDIRDILLTLWILEYSFHQLFLKLNVPFILHHLLFCVQILLNSRRAAMITSNTFPHQLLDCKYKFC